MKKTINLILTAIFIITACVCGFTANHNESKVNSNTYIKTVEVIEVDNQNNVVVCADSNGEAWEFYGAENWNKGDHAILTMDTNSTDNNIYDDEIISVFFQNFF